MPLGCVDQGAILRRPDPHVGPMDDNIQEQAERIEEDVLLAAAQPRRASRECAPRVPPQARDLKYDAPRSSAADFGTVCHWQPVEVR
jgi:hypothetical protein